MYVPLISPTILVPDGLRLTSSHCVSYQWICPIAFAKCAETSALDWIRNFGAGPKRMCTRISAGDQ